MIAHNVNGNDVGSKDQSKFTGRKDETKGRES